MVTIEQTHNRAGGRVLSMAYLTALKAWAGANKLWVHMDGARVFNAAESLGAAVRRQGYGCDEVWLRRLMLTKSSCFGFVRDFCNAWSAGVTVKEIAAQTDTMTFCLSKVCSAVSWLCCVLR